MTWWCVKVAPGREARVRQQLIVALAPLGARVVVPVQPWRRRWGQRWLKLRPGFVFIEADMTGRLLVALDGCRGVGALDGRAGVPHPVPRDVARQLERGHVGAPGKQRAGPRTGRAFCVGRPTP